MLHLSPRGLHFEADLKSGYMIDPLLFVIKMSRREDSEMPAVLAGNNTVRPETFLVLYHKTGE